MRVAGAAKAGVSAWGTTLTLPSPASGRGFLGPNAIALGLAHQLAPFLFGQRADAQFGGLFRL